MYNDKAYKAGAGFLLALDRIFSVVKGLRGEE